MSDKKKERIEVTCGGLKCDNPSCDWTDPTVQVKEYKQWLNAPCPKCGENVLTEEDFKNTMLLRSIISMVNSVPEEDFENFLEDISKLTPSLEAEESLCKKYNIPEGTEHVTMTLDVHKGVHIKDVKPAENSK